MAKKAKEKKGKREEGGEGGEPTCELEAAVPVTLNAGWGPVVDAVRRSRYLQALILLTALGAFLRLFQLGTASLWLDEASTLGLARESVTQIWGSLTLGEFNPPLFYWIEHGMLVFGESEAVLRLVPAILGILTIPVFYLIGKEILDRNTGLIAAALLAFSPFQLYYSQEARAYAPMLFFFSIAFFFFLRLISSWDRRDAALFGLFSALAFWTHFYAFVPILALFLFAIAVRAREMAKNLRSAIALAIPIAVFIVLTLPLLYYAVQLFAARTGSPPAFGIQGADTVIQTMIQLSGFSAILAWVFLALFIVGVASLARRDLRLAILLAFAIVFPLVLSVFLSYKMPMVPRYLIYLLSAFFPGMALALRPVCRFFKSPKLVYAALIIALVVNVPILVPYYTTPQKDDWRGLGKELATVASPGDLIVATPGYVRQPLDYYYHNETAGTLEFGIYGAGEATGLIAAHPGHAAWFVVTADVQAVDPQGLLISWLAQHTHVAWRDTNGGILLLKYAG